MLLVALSKELEIISREISNDIPVNDTPKGTGLARMSNHISSRYCESNIRCFLFIYILPSNGH